MTSPITFNPTAGGRSPQADLIYQEYIKYYTDINNKVNVLDKLPYTQTLQDIVKTNRALLISSQQALYPIYTSHYNNSTATLSTFQSAASAIEKKVLDAYNAAMGIQTPSVTTPPPTSTPPPPSPMEIFTPPPPATTPVAPTPVATTGRSKEASQIYDQYIAYYNAINVKISSLDQLSYAIRTQATVIQSKAKLVALQKELYQLYLSHYNNSAGTLSSFKTAYAAIDTQINQAVNAALAVTAPPPAQPPTTPPPTTTPPPVTTPSTPPPVQNPPPVQGVQPVTQGSPFSNKVENGTWYITWTSWDAPIPEGVNSVNIFVGNMHLDAAGKPVIDGFGTMSQNPSLMTNFIQGCQAKGIPVKISIGGGGGSYDNCWDVLTSSNVKAFAQAFATFCNTNRLSGVDFDCEQFTSPQDKPAQQALVGTLIKEFKLLNPQFEATLCTNAGFGPNFPWPGIVQNIMNASIYTDPVTQKTVCGVDRLYIMAYFNTLSDEKGWVSGWAEWLKTNYKFTPAQVTVGMTADGNAYDVKAFAAWAASQGYSTCYWPYDPARPAASNTLLNSVSTAYKGG